MQKRSHAAERLGAAADTPPDLRTARRLVIIRLSSIGDVTHALPVSAALGDAFPHLEITWMVEEMSAGVVTGNPYLSDVIVLPRGRWKAGRGRSPAVWKEYVAFLRGLRRRRFDVCLDLQGYGKSAILALATGAPHRLGWWRLREGAALASRAIPRDPASRHRVDWFLDVSTALGAARRPVRFPLFVPDASRAEARRLLSNGGVDPDQPYVVINPAVGDQTRRWHTPGFADVIRLLAVERRVPVALVGSAKDSELCAGIRDLALESGDWPSCVAPPGNLAGKTGLKELAALLDGCAAHVSGDTGSAHIAAALGTPVVSLFGPTDPAHAGPWNQDHLVISRRGICRPTCSERGCEVPAAVPNARCAPGAPASMAACLASIDAVDVMGTLYSALEARAHA